VPSSMGQSRTIFSPTAINRSERSPRDDEAQTEVSDLNRGTVVGRDSVDREMCVDEAHLV